MSTRLCGFKPPDERWLQMKQIWDTCCAANVQVPPEVLVFFGYSDPDSRGVEVTKASLEACGALTAYREESREGYEVDLKKLPPDVTVLRFYNSW